MDRGAGISKSTAPSSSSDAPSDSNGSPASILERRNRRRSSALSGGNPVDIPLTDSDQKLAATIARINLESAASHPPKQPVPALIVPSLNLTNSTKAIDPRQSIEKTPTQASFRILSSQRTSRAVVRSHTRDGSRATTTFHLFHTIQDHSEPQTDSNTPTEHEPQTAPVRAKPETSPARSSAGDEESLPSSRTPPSGNQELPPFRTPRGFQLSPNRLFTQRMFTSSPLESPSLQAEHEKRQRSSPLKEVVSRDTTKSSDTEDLPEPDSPCEPFPPFEPCPPFEDY